MSQTDRPHDLHASLDRAIDHALREIVQVDPPDRLGERVMARIASNESRAPKRFAYAAVGVGLAAAAVILLAVFLRSPSTAVRVDDVATSAPPPPKSAAAATSRATVEDPPANAAARPAAPPAPRRTVRAASVETTGTIAPLEPAIGVAKLESPAPIPIPAIAPEQAEAFESLDIPRLEIAPIDMTGKTERR
jgi:hypothetical protein